MEVKEFWEKLSQALDLPFEIEDVTDIEENAGSVWIDTKKGVFSVMFEKCESRKKFLWFDKSGRGFPPAPCTLEDLLTFNDREEPANVSENDELLSEWAQDAEEGEEWVSGPTRYICVES